MNEKQSEPTRIHFDRIVKETHRAVLIEVDDSEHWIPKSQILDAWEALEEGEGPGWIEIPEWLAIERELE